MPSKIAFNDGAAATLQSPITSPGDRFGNWTPDAIDVGDQEVALGTGAVSQFVFRTDYVASFEIRNLTQAELAVALRLKRHLMGGGSCTVTVNDASAHVYTASLQEGTIPQLTLTDPQMIEYTMSLSLKNAAAAAMVADYA